MASSHDVHATLRYIGDDAEGVEPIVFDLLVLPEASLQHGIELLPREPRRKRVRQVQELTPA